MALARGSQAMAAGLTRRAGASAPALRRSAAFPLFSNAKLAARRTAVAAIESAPTSSDAPAAASAAAALVESDADDVAELEEAQQELLKWMLFVPEAAQDADLEDGPDIEQIVGDAEDVDEELGEEVEAMLEQYDYEFKVGDKVMGAVYEVDEDGAYVEIGAKTAGFVPLAECSLAKLKTPLEVLRAGMRREFVVVEEEDDFGEVILSLAALEASVFWARTRQLQEEDITVTVSVLGATRGGLLVQYHHLQGFVPLSQFGSKISAESMETLIGYEIAVKIQEVDEETERLVFSNRRASSDTEVQGFKVGDVVMGTVQTVKPYGAFIDIGGATGLLHVSQISHDRIFSVNDILSEGDKLKVMILSQDRERGRVTLSTKKLEPTPGDMLKNPQLVFEKAEEMAATFRERVLAAEAAARAEEMRMLEEQGLGGGAPAPEGEAISA